jgi:hypothetical protein
MKVGTDTMAEQVETTYTNVALGLFDLTRKMFDLARVNTNAGLNFTAQLMTVKSPWEMAVLSSTHAREHHVAGTQAEWAWSRLRAIESLIAHKKGGA